MRIVIALGGNALQRRGEPMTVASQRANVRFACEAIAKIVTDTNDVVITHGNGPQVGLLALQAAAYDDVSTYPFDVLGAATQGIIGYLIEQELGNLVPLEKHVVTILTQTEVSSSDPAFSNPTKFVGPGYTEERAKALAEANGWVVRQDGAAWRRVVPSPEPLGIFESAAIKDLLGGGSVVIAAGGGGVPTMFEGENLVGVEAVIDKDRAAAVLAREIGAQKLVIATDADAVYLDWGMPEQRAVLEAHPDELASYGFAAGSMGPKVESTIAFARSTGGDAYIGALGELEAMLQGRAGTRVSTRIEGLRIRAVPPRAA